MIATTADGTRHQIAKSLLVKVPGGLLIAALLITAVGVLRGTPTADPTPVERALAAPFHDVGIGTVDDALTFWQARVDAHPSDYISKTRLASSIMAKAKETGDLSLYPKAEAVLRDALALNPIDDGALLALGAARAANHDFTTSIELAGQILERKPWSQATQVAVADGNFELGKYELADRQLDALVRTLPDGIGVESRLAKRATVEGRIDDAIRDDAAAVVAAADLDLRPSEAAFYRFQLGHFLYQAGRLTEALAILDRGLAIDPHHLASLEAKAQVLVSLGRLPDAALLYERLLRQTPAADLHGELAKVYRALGRDADARREVTAGLALGHEQLRRYPAERRHLASFFAEFEPKTALIAAKADFGTRRDIGAYDTLAWAYHQNGRDAEAATYVRGALARGTRDASLLYHAGMIEKAVGHRSRARSLLRQALALNPHFDLIQAPKAARALDELGG